MKVLLVQADGKLPNLALMKLSAYHKTQGDTVGFHVSNPDRVYVSCVFSKNVSRARGTAKFYPDAEFEIGGPGLGTAGSLLPYEVEHSMPDYSLYGIDYSVGFSTRGCIRDCPFCQVHEVEGSFREHASIEEFLHPDHQKLLLFDNNFLASTLWRVKLNYINERGIKVSFTQGLDARLVDDEKAKVLERTESFNTHFTYKTYYFAWDLMHEEDGVLRGLRKMIDAGVVASRIIVYMLVGYNTSHQEDVYRFRKLVELGVEPFVMIFNNRRDDRWLRDFARYVNKWIYRTVEFEKYNRGALVESNS
uniref:Radical SAM superfamily protein n=1 Tax=viral metagenome TaxID=1070528 RepID=A0A6M3M0W4_9ZZZZ